MGWGTNEMGANGMGGAWVLIGGPMRWGTNEMEDRWDGGPLGLAENGWTNEKGDQWEGGPMSSNNVVGDLLGDLWIGGPMRWGTNEMGDQWVGGTNEMGDQWNEWCMGANWGSMRWGDQWDGEPMRWGTNEMGDTPPPPPTPPPTRTPHPHPHPPCIINRRDRPLGTNYHGIWIKIKTNVCNKIGLKMSSAKWRPRRVSMHNWDRWTPCMINRISTLKCLYGIKPAEISEQPCASLHCKLIVAYRSHHMATEIWANISSGDGLLLELWQWLVAWWHQAITWATFDLSLRYAVVFTWAWRY